MKLPKRLAPMLAALRRAQIPLYAGNAAFYLILSILPLFTLLLSALPYTSISPDALLALFSRVAPQSVLPLFAQLLQIADAKRGAFISLSAIASAWSASRGMYGILRGLNAVLDLRETRPYLRVRLLCLFYMLLFVLAVCLMLLLHVAGQWLLGELFARGAPFARMLVFLLEHLKLYSLLLLTALFCLLFLALPNRRQRLSRVFPGALGAAGVWLFFSRCFSFYAAHVLKSAQLYGSLSAMALGMLWVYACVSILFYGAFCNRLLVSRFWRKPDGA